MPDTGLDIQQAAREALSRADLAGGSPLFGFHLVEHKVLYFTRGEVPEGEYLIPFGVADVKREGSDVTVVGIHTQVLEALQAAEAALQDLEHRLADRDTVARSL